MPSGAAVPNWLPNLGGRVEMGKNRWNLKIYRGEFSQISIISRVFFLCVFCGFLSIWGMDFCTNMTVVCIIGRIQNAESNQGHKKRTPLFNNWLSRVMCFNYWKLSSRFLWIYWEFDGICLPQIVIPLLVGVKKGLQKNVGINCHTLTEQIMCQNYKITNTKFALITTKSMPQDYHSFSGCLTNSMFWNFRSVDDVSCCDGKISHARGIPESPRSMRPPGSKLIPQGSWADWRFLVVACSHSKWQYVSGIRMTSLGKYDLDTK